MPLQIEALRHDLDGNLTQDGTFDYAWDAENRLISVTPRSPIASSVRSVFDYDYMNRRIRKRNYARTSGNAGWSTTPVLDRRFLYDGWNLLEELDGLANNTPSWTFCFLNPANRIHPVHPRSRSYFALLATDLLPEI